MSSKANALKQKRVTSSSDFRRSSPLTLAITLALALTLNLTLSLALTLNPI